MIERIAVLLIIAAVALFLTRELWYPNYREKNIIRKVIKMHSHDDIQSSSNGERLYPGCSITWTGTWLVTITDDTAELPPFIATIRREVVRTKNPQTDVTHETARIATLLLNQRFSDSY